MNHSCNSWIRIQKKKEEPKEKEGDQWFSTLYPFQQQKRQLK